MFYPVELVPQDVGGYAVGFPDIPEALTLGDTVEDALGHAADALETALDFYFDHERIVPLPSPKESGQYVVELPAGFSARVLLHNEALARHG